LNLDLDLYSSYKTCSDNLWDNIPPGGIITLDEYQSDKWIVARDSIYEFSEKTGFQVQVDALTG